MLPFISFIGNLARIPLKGLFRKACLVKLVAYCLPLGVSFLCGGGPSELDVMRVMTSWPSAVQHLVLRFLCMVPSEAH